MKPHAVFRNFQKALVSKRRFQILDRQIVRKLRNRRSSSNFTRILLMFTFYANENVYENYKRIVFFSANSFFFFCPYTVPSRFSNFRLFSNSISTYKERICVIGLRKFCRLFRIKTQRERRVTAIDNAHLKLFRSRRDGFYKFVIFSKKKKSVRLRNNCTKF